ncbi:MAG: glycosyltransferase family 4 protein [Thermodesulfobacteriota bacterium]|nr:glycosyltransferase family 4 protein [Thermodesulfobacteriota bacterium]
MKMKRSGERPEVLVITDVSPHQKGGSVKYIFCLLKGLHSRTLVLCPFSKEKFNEKYIIKKIFYSNHNIKSKYLRKVYSIFLYLQLCFIPLFWVMLYFKNIQLIICSEILPGGIAGYLAKCIFGKRYVTIGYGEELAIGKNKKISGYLMKKVLRNAETVVTISTYTRNELITFGVNDEKIDTIYPPVDTSIVPICSKRIMSLQERYELNNKKVVLMIGRLLERKGFDNAIKIFPEVKKKVPSAILVIIGVGEQENYLKKLVNERKLESDVIFFKNLSDEEIRFMYSICDVFLLPARPLKNGDTEGFGIVYIEANLAGKPVIVGKAGGTNDAVINGVTGLLIDGNNLEEIELALVKLLNNPDYAKRLGQQGRKWVLEKFNLVTQQQKFDKLVSGLIQELSN